MKALDRWRALFRLLFLNSDRETISHDADIVAKEARAERMRATAEMDNLLRDLTRDRLQRTRARAAAEANGNVWSA